MVLMQSRYAVFLALLVSAVLPFTRAEDDCQLFFAERTEHLPLDQREFVAIDEITKNITVKLNALMTEEKTIDLFSSLPDRLSFTVPFPELKKCFNNRYKLGREDRTIEYSKEFSFNGKYTYGRRDSNCSITSSWLVNSKNKNLFAYRGDFRPSGSTVFIEDIQGSVGFLLDDKFSVAYVENKAEKKHP
uniref:Uncharacterized protein n=1 Tax=Ditylenchus dipsaci TaxID=166011 RepID=A0A915DVZ1_9BILA